MDPDKLVDLALVASIDDFVLVSKYISTRTNSLSTNLDALECKYFGKYPDLTEFTMPENIRPCGEIMRKSKDYTGGPTAILKFTDELLKSRHKSQEGILIQLGPLLIKLSQLVDYFKELMLGEYTCLGAQKRRAL